MVESMTCTAVIPARGGSKGIPGKNLQQVGGQTLLTRCITTCFDADIFDAVLVSTESDEIAAEAVHSGATVVRRPATLSTDSIMPDPAVIHALEDQGRHPGHVCMLQCTSPLTTADDLRAAWSQTKASGADCVFAATESHVFLWQRDESGWGKAINHDPSKRLSRQELPETFRETGAFFFMKTEGFINARHRFFGHVMPFPVPNERSVDVDTLFDLKFVEFLSKSVP